MHFSNNKNYKIKNLKLIFKKSNLLFFFSDLNKNSQNLLTLKKKLINYKLIINKIINKITIKLIKNSINLPLKFLFLGSLFVLNINNKNLLKTTLTSFNFLFPTILAVKLNKKIYSHFYIKKTYSFNYFQNKQLIKKFCVLKLKKHNSIVRKIISK